MSKYSFNKASRLLSKDDFFYLSKGAKKILTPKLIFFYKPGLTNSNRVGLAFSRKVGNAVVRNVFKRIVREEFRLKVIPNQSAIYDVLVIGRHRKGSEVSKQEIRQSFSLFVKQLFIDL